MEEREIDYDAMYDEYSLDLRQKIDDYFMNKYFKIQKEDIVNYSSWLEDNSYRTYFELANGIVFRFDVPIKIYRNIKEIVERKYNV